MNDNIRMAVVVWDLELPRCCLCAEDGKTKRATKRVEVTLWHGAHGRTVNYECCDEHATAWAAKMEGASERAMRRIDRLIVLGSIVAPYDADGSIRRELLTRTMRGDDA